MDSTVSRGTRQRRADSPVRRTGRRGRLLLVAMGALATGGVLAACSSGSGGSAAAATASSVTVHESVTILTGGMIAQKGWPEFVPADVAVPAGATVDMTIYNFDDGTAALPSSLATYTKATGVKDLVEGGAPVSGMAAADVSHTWTIPQLGINVPIEAAPAANGGTKKPLVVTFTFTAKRAGSYTWRCFAPCGSGSSGMEGAMATDGYMKGTLIVG